MPPRFHGILIVRDEQDVLAQTLAHLLTFCDTLHVLDTGSLDGTWETVTDLARRDSRVRPVLYKPLVYGEWLRAYVFERARRVAHDGDWFGLVDSDEFYVIDAPTFVRERTASFDGCLYGQSYEFRYTRSDLAAWERGEETLGDRARPIEQRRRHYIALEHGEPRWFRYRRGMHWPDFASAPLSSGFIARRRIPIRHYPHRDPVQMMWRCVLRSTLGGFPHWSVAQWRELVLADDTPGLATWEPGQPLPEVRVRAHAAPTLRRATQWLLYASGAVRALDARRTGLATDYEPPAIPPRVIDELSERFAALSSSLA